MVSYNNMSMNILKPIKIEIKCIYIMEYKLTNYFFNIKIKSLRNL